ncbi:MAG: SMP-30/gluconolactonase/LRE family protein [Bryobacterales bacterium]|nr:SMP-30/gluconolactonase/LRE family protein [Bryobacterales bacterium]MDE0628380.1 SMP-30/gluconolactonase/LRE family protein [Bryobacterales bacterium]
MNARLQCLSLAVLLLAACGAPPEPEVAPDPGAGTVLRISDGLDAIVPADAVIEKLAGGMGFTEGPVWVKEPAPQLLFSDIPANNINRWSEGDAEASVFYEGMYKGEPRTTPAGSNGLILDSEGRLLACEHGNRRISRLVEGEWEVVVDNYEGKKLNSPNDLAWHPNGGLYFTDPPYGLPEQEADPARELDYNGIYRLNYETGELHLLSKDQTRPNGIGFSPDGSTAYVANSDAAKKLWMAYDVNADGMFENGRVFYDATAEEAPGMPDGLKIDTEGNIYATGPGGVWIFSPDGTHLGSIQPDEVPANVAWGDDGSTLYMTARTGLYRIKLLSSGEMPADMAGDAEMAGE